MSLLNSLFGPAWLEQTIYWTVNALCSASAIYSAVFRQWDENFLSHSWNKIVGLSATIHRKLCIQLIQSVFWLGAEIVTSSGPPPEEALFPMNEYKASSDWLRAVLMTVYTRPRGSFVYKASFDWLGQRLTSSTHLRGSFAFFK